MAAMAVYNPAAKSIIGPPEVQHLHAAFHNLAAWRRHRDFKKLVLAEHLPGYLFAQKLLKVEELYSGARLISRCLKSLYEQRFKALLG